MTRIFATMFVSVLFLHFAESTRHRKDKAKHTNDKAEKRQFVFNDPTYRQYKTYLKNRIQPLSALPVAQVNNKHVARKGPPLYNDKSTSHAKQCDEAAAPKKGSFKIDDGLVQGFGTYEYEGDDVDIDITIKISKCPVTPTPTSAPGGETTPAPGGSTETTPAPNAGGETTAAPGVTTETTAAPSGETTATPGSTTAASGSTTTAPTQGSSSGDAFQQEALTAHNDYRTRHDAPPMTLNQTMSTSAAEWAKHLGENDLFEHSSADERENQGENIAAWCDATGETATQVTKRWYDEVCNPGYDFSRNDMDWAAGHFTQIVWIASTQLGIGYYDKLRDDGWVCRTIVARYQPPGNGGGTFLENVKKGSFDSSVHCSSSSKRRTVHVL